MSTHCLICRKNADPSYDYIYCHWDGDYEHAGNILLKYYNMKEKVDALITLGDLSSIEEKLNPTTDSHSFLNPEPGVCVAYGRDRHEKGVGPHHCTTIDPNAEEYVYLYENGEWYTAVTSLTKPTKWQKLSSVITKCTKEVQKMTANEWLKSLQQKLIEDRENEHTQRSPLYYGIIEDKSEPCRDGDGDDYSLYNTDNCDETLSLTEFGEKYKDEIIAYQVDNFMDIIEPDTGNIVSTDGIIDFIHEIKPEYEMYETKIVTSLVTDRLFLTRKDAQAYLQAKGYNHNNARSYAMTAQDSPDYEKLIEFLTTIDFDKSEIVLKGE